MANRNNIKYIEDRIGQTKINKQGLKMEVIDYKTAHEMYVKFDDGTIVKCMWKEFNNCSLNNPMKIVGCAINFYIIQIFIIG